MLASGATDVKIHPALIMNGAFEVVKNITCENPLTSSVDVL